MKYLLCLTILLLLPPALLTRQTIVIDSESTAATDWPVATPESQGIDSDIIASAIETLHQRQAPIHSLLIVRNGKLAVEAYFHPYDGKTPHDIASVTKPITTTLIGLALQEGRFTSVSEPMLSIFGNRAIANADARKQAITLEHLLTMSSGLGISTRGGEPTLWEMLASPDNVGFMLNLPMSDEPGAKYAYNSGGMHLLSGAISARTGRSAESFAQSRLFQPLGITRWNWPRDPQGVSHGFGNLHLLPRDMARLGWMFLDGGRWRGRQIIPADWVANATQSHIRTGGPGSSDYGYGWRIPTNGGPVTFEASGRGGQQISILRDAGTVIVITGGGFNSAELMKQIFTAIRSNSPLPEPSSSRTRLRRAIAAALRPPAPRPLTALPEIARSISGKTWNLPDNWLGLKSLALSFTTRSPLAEARLTFGPSPKQQQFGASARMLRSTSVTETRPIGLDGVPRISPQGMLGMPVALRGDWIDNQTFQLEYNEIANTNTYLLRLHFSDNRLKIEASERTGLFRESYETTSRPLAKFQ